METEAEEAASPSSSSSPRDVTDDALLLEASDLSDGSRNIWIVTTAALPWMTGTAVNPLLRALYLQRTRSEGAHVTLMLPWLEEAGDRTDLYGSSGHTFDDGPAGRQQQESYLRHWAVASADTPPEVARSLRLRWYPSRYHKNLGSILPLVDLCSLVQPEDQPDVAILEEPEHLNWLPLPSRWKIDKHGKEKYSYRDFFKPNDSGWTDKFRWVVGVVHTNYPAYAKSYGPKGSRHIAAKTIDELDKLVSKAYCHKLIKLSATLPVLAKYKEIVANVHGVRSDFLQTNVSPEERQQTLTARTKEEGLSDVYFIGKIIWGKGFDFMLHCQNKFHDETGSYFPLNIYGSGPDEEAIKRAFYGVRKHKNDDSSKEQEQKDKSDEGFVMVEHDDEDLVLKEDDMKDKNVHGSLVFYKELSNLILTANDSTPADLDDEEDKGEEDTKHKSSPPAVEKSKENPVFKTIKDSISLIKRIPQETNPFQFETLPKSRWEWRKTPIPARFMGRKDHGSLKRVHKIFLNPSITEVLCTTSAEALAMGKFVILPAHPSNEFFYQFPNCLVYSTLDEFVTQLRFALEHEPEHLTDELAFLFTWEAATNRLVDASAMTKEQYDAGKTVRDHRKAWAHKKGGKMIRGDLLKNLVGDPPSEQLSAYTTTTTTT